MDAIRKRYISGIFYGAVIILGVLTLVSGSGKLDVFGGIFLIIYGFVSLLTMPKDKISKKYQAQS